MADLGGREHFLLSLEPRGHSLGFPWPTLAEGCRRAAETWRPRRKEGSGRGSELGQWELSGLAWKAPLLKNGLPDTQINGLSFC